MSSDTLLEIALHSGEAVFALTFVLVLAISVMRYMSDRRRAHARALSETWLPVFAMTALGERIAEMPSVHSRDHEIVLRLWLHYVESVRGDARESLRQLAIDLGLDRVAHRMLGHGNIRLRLVAVAVLGRLPLPIGRQDLERWVDDANPVVSLAALQSLLMSTPPEDQERLLNVLFKRADYPLSKIAAILKELPTGAAERPLLNAIAIGNAQDRPRLLALLKVGCVGDAWPVLEPLLEPHQPVDVLAAALKASPDPRALSAARTLAIHPSWVVRAQAVQTIGRLGTSGDRLRLQAMLADPHWWVRYRSARALVALPGVRRHQLLIMKEKMNDRFAADILAHALAESSVPDTK